MLLFDIEKADKIIKNICESFIIYVSDKDDCLMLMADYGLNFEDIKNISFDQNRAGNLIDFLMESEDLLIDFCEQMGHKPELVNQIWQYLHKDDFDYI